jgi:phytoene dehydrogenase-like protein
MSQFYTARTLARYLNTRGGAVYGFAPQPPSGFTWKRSVKTAIPGLFLASSYAATGGFTGAIAAGASAADLILSRQGPGR